METSIIYADNAASTKPNPEVLKVYFNALSEFYGNPASIHKIGDSAKKLLEDSRAKIADLIGCKPCEIVFTSGATEANNLAIKGTALSAAKNGKKHIIVSKCEHSSVLEACAKLERNGFEITYINVDRNGLIDTNELSNSIRPDTALVGIMYANNEVGTVLPVSQIGVICQKAQVPFFTDAVQAAGYLEIDVAKLNCQMLSVSGHKLGAPKGVGFLYIKDGIKPESIFDGGGQENGFRPGTQNAPSAAALAKALEIAIANQKNNAELSIKRDYLISEISKIKGCKLTGHPKHRLPSIASFVFEEVSGESLALLLNAWGICVSTGSACSSGKGIHSHVLEAMGVEESFIDGSLRISISHETTENEIKHIASKVKCAISKLREC